MNCQLWGVLHLNSSSEFRHTHTSHTRTCWWRVRFVLLPGLSHKSEQHFLHIYQVYAIYTSPSTVTRLVASISTALFRSAFRTPCPFRPTGRPLSHLNAPLSRPTVQTTSVSVWIIDQQTKATKNIKQSGEKTWGPQQSSSGDGQGQNGKKQNKWINKIYEAQPQS